jgi:hypothetical protein
MVVLQVGGLYVLGIPTRRVLNDSASVVVWQGRNEIMREWVTAAGDNVRVCLSSPARPHTHMRNAPHAPNRP